MEKGKSFVEAIKRTLDEASGGGGGGSMPEELLFVPRDGEKIIRFLSEFDKGTVVTMHDKWEVLRPQPCLKYYGEDCPYHGEGWRTKDWYAWTVYDYSSKTRRVALWKATLASPVEQMYDAFQMNGTITDRDWKVSRAGSGMKSRWRLKPATPGPTPFEGAVDVPFTDRKIFEVLKKLVREPDVKRKDDDEEGIE